MKLTATVQRRKGKSQLETIRRNFLRYNNEDVEIGYFNGEQHSEADLSYASLALILEKGSRDGTIPARFLFETVSILNSPDTSIQARNLIVKGLSTLNNRDTSTDTLEGLGRLYQQLLKDGMGMSPPLESNAPSVIAAKGRNSPYVDSGELEDNLGYRTSKSGAIRK